jgi:hypothetical protein
MPYEMEVTPRPISGGFMGTSKISAKISIGQARLLFSRCFEKQQTVLWGAGSTL